MSGDEPRRWLESDDVPEALREDLGRAAAHDVGYDVAAGAARFEAAPARGGPPGGDGGGAAAAAGGKGGLMAIGLVVAVAGGAIGWALLDREPGGGGPAATQVAAAPDDVAEREEEVERELVPPSSPEPVEVETLDAEDADDAAAVESAPPIDARTTSTAKPKPRAKAPTRPTPDDDRLRREMQATDRARQVLATDPARALSLVKEADREFPQGLFAEDREGIAILALFGLGRDEQARRRAQAFLRAHPRSSHADRIRAALDDREEP